MRVIESLEVCADHLDDGAHKRNDMVERSA